MKVFGITWPSKYTGGSAVVVAPNKKRALEVLQDQMNEKGLGELSNYTVAEVSATRSKAVILSDGDY